MDPVTIAAITTAAAQVGGSMLSSKRSKTGPTRQPTVANPNFDAAMGRYIGFIDKYMQKHGMGGQIPKPKTLAPQIAPRPVDSRLRKDITADMVDPNTVSSPVPASTGATSPADTGTGDWVRAGIGAAGEIAGAYAKPRAKSGLLPTQENPYYWPVQERYQAIMDNILGKYGVDVSQAPEWKNEYPVAPVRVAPVRPIEQKDDDKGQFGGFLPSYSQTGQKRLGVTDQGYSDSALAAKLAARRMGMSETPNFPTTLDFAAQDEASKQEELQRLQNYILGSRQVSMR